LGVPVAPVLSSGTTDGLPYIVMPRLPGADLGAVYPSLTTRHKLRLADDICRVQRLVHALPGADAFGFAHRLGAPSRPTWKHVLLDNIERSRVRIRTANLISTSVLKPLLDALDRFDDYFESIRPVPFLDDTTTKNVLVHDGALS